MLSNIGPVRTLSYGISSIASAGSTTYIPVNPKLYVYSQFQYVAGVPAPQGQEGVSIDKLRMLNTLIDQLVSMKQKNLPSKFSDQQGLSGDQIDSLIKEYQNRIKVATAAAENLPYKPPMPQPGAVVNLVA
jgi:predicted butyrate kinase (DUF1464 family)